MRAQRKALGARLPSSGTARVTLRPDLRDRYAAATRGRRSRTSSPGTSRRLGSSGSAPTNSSTPAGCCSREFDAVEQARVGSNRRRGPEKLRTTTPAVIEALWIPNLGDALVAAVLSWQRSAASPAVPPAESAALQWLLDVAPADHPERTQGRRIGVGEVTGLRMIRTDLKEIDNSLGGGAALPMTLAHLRQHVPTLLNCQYSERIGRGLMSAVSELTLDLGWMAYDCGMHADARSQMLLALRLSHAAGDRLFGMPPPRCVTKPCISATSARLALVGPRVMEPLASLRLP